MSESGSAGAASVGGVPAVALPHGAQMPLLGFGTWQTRGSETYDSVRAALDVGYRHLDTATMYQNEQEVGRALRDSGVDRREVFITTKMPPELAHQPRATLEDSLRDLGIDQVDLWLIHWPPDREARPDVWDAFVQAREDGRTREIGVSNYSLAQIDEITAATEVAPAVDQIKWSPARYDAAVAAGLAERGVVLEGYSPFRSSDLDNRVIARIAESYGKSVPQIILRWHLDHGYVAIPKSVHADRIAANFDVLDFALAASDVAALDALGG